MWEGLFNLEKENDQVRPHPSLQIPEIVASWGMLFSPAPAARGLEENRLKLRLGGDSDYTLERNLLLLGWSGIETDDRGVTIPGGVKEASGYCRWAMWF